MSATSRDSSELKEPVSNPTDAPATDTSAGDTARCCKTQPEAADATHAPLGIMAALCRMALVRTTSLTVNGAYVRGPEDLKVHGSHQDA